MDRVGHSPELELLRDLTLQPPECSSLSVRRFEFEVNDFENEANDLMLSLRNLQFFLSLSR